VVLDVVVLTCGSFFTFLFDNLYITQGEERKDDQVDHAHYAQLHGGPAASQSASTIAPLMNQLFTEMRAREHLILGWCRSLGQHQRTGPNPMPALPPHVCTNDTLTEFENRQRELRAALLECDEYGEFCMGAVVSADPWTLFKQLIEQYIHCGHLYRVMQRYQNHPDTMKSSGLTDLECHTSFSSPLEPWPSDAYYADPGHLVPPSAPALQLLDDSINNRDGDRTPETADAAEGKEAAAEARQRRWARRAKKSKLNERGP
jgi:hypothetical protein